MPQTLASLSIAARAIIDMHSLNNEGGEGNQIQTRMVDIIGADGRMYNVNAISGDMLKHIQSQHFFELAREQGLPLCEGCRELNANRINADAKWIGEMPKGDRDALRSLLQHCALDDIAGILITASGRSLPRKSVVEFGWVVGVPQLVTSDNYFHVKYAGQRDKENADKDAKARQDDGSNLGQSIFHRPASSGVYAIVCHIELARIGYNDIAQTYDVDETQRVARARAVLQSVLHTFIELNGAMRTTQLPHLVSLNGIITTSATGAIPAPLISPLAGGDSYVDEVKAVATALDAGRGRVHTIEFASLGTFADSLSGLVTDVVPASLVTAR
jgi:CRISPR-associated protein Cst2